MRQIPGLLIDFNSGEGDIRFPVIFASQSALFRANVLQDWLVLLNTEYLKAREELTKDQT